MGVGGAVAADWLAVTCAVASQFLVELGMVEALLAVVWTSEGGAEVQRVFSW